MKKDYYTILGVNKDASSDEIKKAYRKLSKQYHPDVSGKSNDSDSDSDSDSGNDDMFKNISEAYSVLSDESKRSNYDHGGSSFNPFTSSSSSRGYSNFGFDDLFRDMGGFSFDDIFGRRGRSPNKNRPGSDIKVTIEVTLDEVEIGSSRKIKYKRKENCTGCDGKGGKDEKPCISCNGTGSRINTTKTPMGIIQQQIICNNCGGTGRIIINKCNVCHGAKHKEIPEELIIDIPIGISDESLYKYEGKGHSNRYGTGSLLVHFRIKQHRYFKKQGKNLIYNIELPFNILVYGGMVKIKGLNNKIIEADIPSMTKPGYMLRIKGSGLPNPDNMLDKGDVILNIGVEFPNEVNEEELEIISKLNNKLNFIYKQK